MKDFLARNKVFLIISLVTLALIFGGIFLFSKQSPASSLSGNKISDSILISPASYKTSGFVNGIYLPSSSSATISLVEFGDYECPACAIYATYVKQVLTDFAGKVTYVFRNYPLPQHKNANISSYAVEAAGIQGKYWEMYEKMYSTQNDWANSTDPTSIFVEYARQLGLDVNKFSTDLNSQTVKDIVAQDVKDGNTVNLTETPTFYLNGQKVTLTNDPNLLHNLIQTEASK